MLYMSQTLDKMNWVIFFPWKRSQLNKSFCSRNTKDQTTAVRTVAPHGGTETAKWLAYVQGNAR